MYLKIPEVSSSLLPPYWVLAEVGNPSIKPIPAGVPAAALAGRLFWASPKITIPPQSPMFLWPGAALEANTIGLIKFGIGPGLTCPSANILPLVVIIKKFPVCVCVCFDRQ